MPTMSNDIRKIRTSMATALSAIVHAYHHDRSFRLEVNWGIPVFLFLAFVFSPLSEIERLWMVMAYLLVLAFELTNCAIEQALDRLHPEQHPDIGLAKDLASAAVFVTFLHIGVMILFFLASRVM